MISEVVLAMMIALAPVGSVIEQAHEEAKDAGREYVGTVTISAYNFSENGTTTASSETAQAYKSIATHSGYPFGTVLYIEGIGECVVHDRGGELISSGKRIDLYIGHDDVDAFGLQEKKVWIVK